MSMTMTKLSIYAGFCELSNPEVQHRLELSREEKTPVKVYRLQH